ncbi:hypothetical protein [Nocardia heshunensis]
MAIDFFIYVKNSDFVAERGCSSTARAAYPDLSRHFRPGGTGRQLSERSP